jgi:hypothetical protein
MEVLGFDPDILEILAQRVSEELATDRQRCQWTDKVINISDFFGKNF